MGICGVLQKGLGVLSMLTLFVCGETVVSGRISESERWTRENSPYVVTNDILISRSGRLVIEPGVEIIVEAPQNLSSEVPPQTGLDSFYVFIIVEGALRCRGSMEDPVIIRGRYVDDMYAHWGGFRIDSERSREVEIGFTHINNAVRALHIRQGMPLIRNALIHSNNLGMRIENRAAPRIIQSVFIDNYVAAVRIENANPYFFNSIIYNNINMGVWGDGVSDFTFEHNLVYRNGARNFVGAPPVLGVLTDVNSAGDSVDVFDNLIQDPLFAGSAAEKQYLRSLRRRKEEESLDPLPEEITFTPISERRYRLSRYSPARSAGKPGRSFLTPEGTPADLGIWSGPEFFEY
jgi:hypothetical protein